VDDVEDLSVDVDHTRGDEESTGSHQLYPLTLLQQLNFLLWRYLLFHVRLLQFLLLGHLIAHLLQLALNLSPLFLYLLLKLLIVICFFSELHPTARVLLITVVLMILEPQLHMDPQSPQVVNHYFFDIDVFKCVRVVDELCFVLQSVGVFFESVGSSTVRTRTDIVDPLRLHSSRDEPADEGNRVRCTSIDCDVLRLFLALKELYVLGGGAEVLVEVGIIDGV
jgi:hypothetical protein